MSQAPSANADRRFGGGGPTLAEVGETALLDELVAIAATVTGGGGHGADDAAVWSPAAGRDLVESVDALVEEVDFRRSWIGPRQLGRRAFTVAVSDLAAMGAEPVHCLATICAPSSEQFEDLLELQRGLCEAAASVGCAVIGGDVSAIAGPLVVVVSVTGSLAGGMALRRAAGLPGDLLVVTGVLGRAAAGLRLLLEGSSPATDAEAGWVRAQLQPPVRLGEGMRLLQAGVRCAGDISDGLLLDAARTARACGCAAEIWAASLPVDGELRDRFGQDWLQPALGGGEDFELLAALPEADADALLRGWPSRRAPLAVVGRLRLGEGVHLLDRRGGVELPQPAPSARHFS